MSVFKDLSKATLLIECGNSKGSGFHFITPELIVTNYHVVEDCIIAGESVLASTDEGDEYTLDLLDYSDDNKYDYAIFNTQDSIGDSRIALIPATDLLIEVGREIAFAGYPHGLADLLIQRAIVAGIVDDKSYYMDGSINGGNSGGPIVDIETGKLVGIVTERRFMGSQDLEVMGQAASQIQQHWKAVGNQGSVQIMGMDMGAFAKAIAESTLLIKEVIEANANSGIGIGYSSEFIAAACKDRGFEKS
jgi:hypothetical protein